MEGASTHNTLSGAPPGRSRRFLHTETRPPCRRYAVSSGALRPTWSPPTSIRSTLLHLDFHLRLMTSEAVSVWHGLCLDLVMVPSQRCSFHRCDVSCCSSGDWSSERESSVYVLGETVNIEASVDHHHLPLRLYADSCVATLTPDVNSYPRYPFIDHQGWVFNVYSGSSYECCEWDDFLSLFEAHMPDLTELNTEGRSYI